ncbi:hypothetical protein C6503_06335 [Candidatus Poribacteria bacterium]|nr:MAG: hypothetical protein C6503_06335 [Candidatus Poribacteria bacterium]
MEEIAMRPLKWIFACLLVLFAMSFVFMSCTPQVMGKTGFDVELSVTGMTRVTSVFSVMRSLKKADALVFDDAVYKVTQLEAPLNGWHLDPNEPQRFTVEVWALRGSDPAQGANAAISERVKAALIKTVENLGFQASVESIEPRKVVHKLVIN